MTRKQLRPPRGPASSAAVPRGLEARLRGRKSIPATADVPPLPHERDQSPADDVPVPAPDASGSLREVTKQAATDLARGLQDSDCRAPHGPESVCPPAPSTGAVKRRAPRQ